jgi:pyruvate/2-oxoglutarate dehydrogenase complex dihydrolipoamide dehydrogenase (E3) component
MGLERFDAIVLGTGQAGKPLALDLGGAGRRTSVVEREYVGGTCVNVGCTPTKTMVASARVAYLARRAAEYGVRCGAVAVDMTQVRQRKQTIVDDFRTGGQRRLEKAENVALIFGEGRFTAPKVVEVTLRTGGVRTLSADALFINPGARPARAGIDALDSVNALESTSIMELSELPEHLPRLGRSLAQPLWRLKAARSCRCSRSR